MLYHRDALRAAALAVSKDATRPALLGVHLDGAKAIGCDGHVLISVPAAGFPDAEFPNRLAADAPVVESAPVTIDAKILTDAAKATPKNGMLPVLHCVQIAGKATIRDIVATDLDHDYKVTARDLGTYPNWEQITPKDAPQFSIGMGVGVLLKILKALDAAGVETVKVDFRDAKRAVTMTGTCELGEVFAMAMPVRLPGRGNKPRRLPRRRRARDTRDRKRIGQGIGSKRPGDTNASQARQSEGRWRDS